MRGDEQIEADQIQSKRKRFGVPGRLFLVGVTLALAIIYLIILAFPGNTSYYLTVDELQNFEGDIKGNTFSVKGHVASESFERELGTTRATFEITSGGENLKASYDGVVPDLFFNPQAEVILHGRYLDGNIFVADTVSVLCPTKYEAL